MNTDDGTPSPDDDAPADGPPTDSAPIHAPAGPPITASNPTETPSETSPTTVASEPMRPSFFKRTGVLVSVIVVLAIALAVAAMLAVTARGDASDEADRATAAEGAAEDLQRTLDEQQTTIGDLEDNVTQLERSVTDVEGERDEASAALSTVETDLAEAQSTVDSVTSELDGVRDELDDFGELYTVDDLLDHKERLIEMWEDLAAATNGNDVLALVSRFDRPFNELVGSNVTSDLRDCKETLANNGYTSFVLFSSSVLGLYEIEAPETEEFLQVVADDLPFIRELLTDVCG